MKAKLVNIFVCLFVVLFAASCGEKPATTTGATTTGGTTTGGTTTGGTTTGGTVSQATKISIFTQSSTVKSDGSSSANVIATVLDGNNAAVEGALINFSTTDAGRISASSAVSDINGEATVTFKANTSKVNQVATVTATLQGVTPSVSVQVPIQITGTTISLTSQATSLTSNGTIQDNLTIQVKDAGNNPVFNTPVVISQSGTGSLIVTQPQTNTDVSGTVQATVAGSGVGSVTLTVDAAGAKRTQTYNIAAAGAAFTITSPATDPSGGTTNIAVPVVVNAPGIATVEFATSLGYWRNTPGLQVVDSVPVGGVATEFLTSTSAGSANIQVTDKLVATSIDTATITFSHPVSAAATINLQSNASVVSPSVGGVSNSVAMTATVRNTAGQVVGGAPVHFTIPNPTGAGETIAPVIAYTDSFGKATATFISGSVGSGAQGVDVYATVLTVPAGAIPSSLKNIVVGGTAASVVIGKGSKIIEKSPTEYSFFMSVQVTDSNGNGVPNTLVSLNIWPKAYRFGFWEGTADCVPHYHLGNGLINIPNEDINRNLLNDLGEDIIHTVVGGVLDPYGTLVAPFTVLNAAFSDGTLTPANSSAGSIPATVTTDSNGIANFDHVYLKQYAAWVDAEITASVQVLGTETTSSLVTSLSALKSDAAACILPTSSPFNGGAF